MIEAIHENEGTTIILIPQHEVSPAAIVLVMDKEHSGLWIP